MKIGNKIYVRDLETNNFDILTSGNAVVVAVKMARGAAEEEEAEGEAAADGEATPAEE
jgi:ribosomal protein L12E/L44/L45/RPP1/RPP2